MRNVNIKQFVILVIAHSLTAVKNGYGAGKSMLDNSKQETSQSKIEDVGKITRMDITEKQKHYQRILTGKHYGLKRYDENKKTTNHLKDNLRKKRSVLLDVGYDLPLQEGFDIADKTRRFLPDYLTGSKLQAGENMANINDYVDLAERQGRGSDGKIDEMMNGETVKDEYINIYYNYLRQAAENDFLDWDRNVIFGGIGQGEISNHDQFKDLGGKQRIPADVDYGLRTENAENTRGSSLIGSLHEVYKPKNWRTLLFFLPGYENVNQLISDYGYGSRFEADKYFAKSASQEMFGAHGSRKRSDKRTHQMKGELPDIEYVRKRYTSDFGYGSREQAAENLAKDLGKGKIFGVYGPGKRSVHAAESMQGKLPDLDIFYKRFSSDFGYGSREQVAENLAKSSANENIFGVYGPGKRSVHAAERRMQGKLPYLDIFHKRFSSDFGYGSREQVAENLATSSANGNIFGEYGPGKR